MGGRADFSVEEWGTLQRALLSGAALVNFWDGGRPALQRELPRIVKQVRAAGSGHSSQLIRELAADPGSQTVIARNMSPGEAEVPVMEVLQAAVALLSERLPEEREAFRGFALDLAERAARASRSGGVFGIGGQRVSYAEASALQRVSQALGAGS